MFFIFLATIIIYVVVNFILWKKGKPFNKHREFIKFMFLIYFLGVNLYTLSMYLYHLTTEGYFNYVPFKETLNMFYNSSVRLALHNVIGNIIMLMPLGMFVGALYKKSNSVLKIAGISFMCSSIIEFNQFFTGRVADVDDIIFNTLGGVLGYLVYKLLIPYVKKIKFFKTMFDSSINEKSAVKGILVVTIPFLIFAGLDHMRLKNEYLGNSVDVVGTLEELKDDNKEIILDINEDDFRVLIYKDLEENFLIDRYNKLDETYFEEVAGHIINEGEQVLYKANDKFISLDQEGVYSINDIYYVGELSLFINLPIGSEVSLAYGDKKISFKTETEFEYKEIDIKELEVEIKSDFSDSFERVKDIKIEVN